MKFLPTVDQDWINIARIDRIYVEKEIPKSYGLEPVFYIFAEGNGLFWTLAKFESEESARKVLITLMSEINVY